MTKKEKKQLDEILKALLMRDKEDQEAEKEIRKDLLGKGMIEQLPQRIVEIDSGKIVGVGNVVKEILKTVKAEDKFIALEGHSGTGKSSVADALALELKAIRFSLGEIFRFFAHCSNVNQTFSFENIVKDLYYSIDHDEVHLFWGKKNVTKELKEDLRSKDLEKIIPKVSRDVYDLTIGFIDREIKRLKKSQSYKFVIEGRGLSLDFLPGDLRIKLTADPLTRAERRLAQNHR